MSLAGRGADYVGALLFAIMFASFILQVFSRYVLNAPIGWTLEACLLSYIWFVFWASSFMLKEEEHVSFTLLSDGAPPPVRRLLLVLSTVLTGGIFLLALPATADWVAFMKIDKTWDLHIRFDLVYSIFVVFMAAVILRAAFKLVRLFGRDWRTEV